MFVSKQKLTDGGSVSLCHIHPTTPMALVQRRWVSCGIATDNK